MAKKKPAPSAGELMHDYVSRTEAMPGGRDARDEIIAKLQNQLVAMEGRFAALEASAHQEFLPPEEMPVFEVGPGGYYSADDVLYPEGVQIEDVTGFMPLNEQLIPLNGPAHARMERYLHALPRHGTPSHEFVLEAAFRRLGNLSSNPEDRAAFFAGVLEDAASIRMTQLGLAPGEPMGRAAAPMPARRPAAPLMSNTRIRNDVGPTGNLPLGALARGAVKTRVRAPAAAPANKAAPPIGGVPTTNIGRAGPGAQAV